MTTAHNVKDMTTRDGKFRFRLKAGRPGSADRFVWAYILTDQFPIVKIDGEHTYLWVNDPRIDQVILDFLQGGSYQERVQAHEAARTGCRVSRDGEVCLWDGCPLTGGEDRLVPGDKLCPLDRATNQDELELGEETA